MTGNQSPRKDVWAAGDLYEPYVGRWSRQVAREFFEWLAVPEERDWLDVGCGTGALTQAILDHASPKHVRSVDASPGYIEYAKAHVTAGSASFEVGDAQSLPVDTASVDTAVAGLMLNFVPQPQRAVAELSRATRQGGVVAAYVWGYAGKMELMRYFWDAAVELDPAASELDEGRRFPICQPEPLTELFTPAGLHHVEARPIDIPTGFRVSTTTGRLSSAGRVPRRAMPFRSTRRARLLSKSGFDPDCPLRKTARSSSLRARGRFVDVNHEMRFSGPDHG